MSRGEKKICKKTEKECGKEAQVDMTAFCLPSTTSITISPAREGKDLECATRTASAPPKLLAQGEIIQESQASRAKQILDL